MHAQGEFILERLKFATFKVLVKRKQKCFARRILLVFPPGRASPTNSAEAAHHITELCFGDSESVLLAIALLVKLPR